MRHLALARVAPCAATAVALAVLAGAARAEEPRKVTEPSVLHESAEVTSVADAFDDEDKFDLHLTLGFQYTRKSGRVNRETNSDLPEFSSGGFVAGNQSVANYTETTSRLNTRADIGLYKDIALVVRLPVILANDRKLDGVDGSENHQSVILQGAPGEQLFSMPFKSPTRSGIEYLAVGLDVDAMNQQRDRTKPTWLIGLEGRFSVSEPMHACTQNGPLNLPGNPQQSCAFAADINRDGNSQQSPGPNGKFLDGSNYGPSAHRTPGVSRGTTGLQLHTYISKRTKYIEPYGGFETLFEFQNNSSDFGGTDLQGSLVNHPPFQGTLIGGLAVIPWEIRDQFQRIELDFRAKGTYRSEGRDYSPLFDALGSSDAASIRRPNFASFSGPNGAPSTVNPSSEMIYMQGITDVQQHGIYSLSAQFTFQAGEYVKFNVGTSFTAEQGHIITLDQPCNPDFQKDPGTAGPCHADSGQAGQPPTPTGIPNPNYRPVIDAPGRRFRFDNGTLVDAWVNAVVMF